MPLLLLGALGVFGAGAGVKMAGDGVDETGNGALKIAVAGLALGAAYYFVKVKKG